jgi:phosphoglycerate kinase
MESSVRPLARHEKLFLPFDVVTAKNLRAQSKTRRPDEVKRNEWIYDIGPKTIMLFKEIIGQSETIIWNGPMGLNEYPAFRTGTREISRSLMRSKKRVVVGGGETLASMQPALKHSPNIFVSSGGGAMLEFLERENLPALLPLIIK